ncbi:hypothetical protein RND81_14G039200 [Saponaria officinalis]|uniref:Glucan endo-1,3-beta-D-glucosidase n=1 Tax=Saponaria officinalis TaxID=3572 RepID=A0AAW1GN04_SAPOF
MAFHKMISFLVVGILVAANLHLSDAHVGVLYGTMGDNLPAPKEVVCGLLASNNITRVRLLEPNKEVLTALKGKNVEVLLGFPNQDIFTTTTDPLFDQWVSVNVKPYVPDVKIKYIVLGTDLSRNSDHNKYTFGAFPVMQGIHKSLQKQGIKDVKVTTSCDPSIIMQNGPNPAPSTVKMWNESATFLKDVLKFISENGAPLFVNMHPYYELIKHPNEVKLDFALFNATGNVLTDGKLGYQNKFDAMLDSFYTALEKEGYPEMDVIISETGWPSAGGVAATPENQKMYITNLVQHLSKGTPKRPNKPIQVYLNLFDENRRGRPEIEKHFGVFTADQQPKFPVHFN